jgi:hypothetical protein
MKTKFWVLSAAAVFLLNGANAKAQEAAVEIENQGNIERIRNRLDFISHMGDPLPENSAKTKEAVLESLGRLTAGVGLDCNPDLVQAWNLLDQTTALSPKQKAEWVERRMADLPPPFVMLAAVCRSKDDPKSGIELYLFSRIRLTLDAAKCADPSAEEASMRVVERLLPQLNIGVDRSETSDETYSQRFLDLMRKSKAGAFKLLEKTANHATRPWWVAHAGLDELIRAGTAAENSKSDEPKRPLFKPEKEWPNIEREIIQSFREQLSAP